MSAWRVRQQYGFGAAEIELAAEPHFVAHRSLSMSGALHDAGRDFYLSTLPPMLLAAFMVMALFVTVSKDHGYTDLEVVMIEREVIEVAEEIPEPEPVIEPEPEPEPVKLAEKKPEPPPPVKKVALKPKPPPPPPVQKIAKLKPPPKPKPRAKPKPKPIVKPQIDAVALAPAPKPPAPPPVRRGNRVREQVKPKLALAPVAKAPKLVAENQADRTRRFAAVRAPTASSRPRADLGPPIAARSLSAPSPERPAARTRRAAPRNAVEKRQMAAVSFAAAAAPGEVSTVASPAKRRSRPVAQPSRARRAAPPPMQMAAAAPAGARAAAPVAARRTVERDRTQRNSGTRTRANHAAGRGLAGVPLASLAACVSDREEDALKRRLVAAVTTQSECVSRAGTYRFVETKNLNAFLMTIDRASGRREGDRCVELEYALECVSR
jgi:hypothetical protein